MPLRRLFWRDMLVVGTFVSLLDSFAALWRRPGRPFGMAVVAAGWLVLMTLL